MSASDREGCSERMRAVFVSAMQEILGARESLDLLARAGCAGSGGLPFEVIGRLQEILTGTFGPQASRGVSLRMGRAAFKYALRTFGSELGLDGLSYRLLPLQERIRRGLERLIALFDENTSLAAQLEWEADRSTWTLERCPFCPALGLAPGQPLPTGCDWMVGFLQEAQTWMSGGKWYLVREENCIASGSPQCRIVIERKPIG
jgi:predicted hydrocarbon binding protein